METKMQNGVTAQAEAVLEKNGMEGELLPENAGRIDDVVKRAAEKAVYAAAKKKEAVFKSMLRQNGVENAEGIEELVAQFRQEQRPEDEAGDKDAVIAAMKAEFNSQREGWEREKKAVAAENELLAMEVDPEFLPLVLADAMKHFERIELDGMRVKDNGFLQEYRKKYPRAFMQKSVKAQPPRVTAEVCAGDDLREKRKISMDAPHFF